MHYSIHVVNGFQTIEPRPSAPTQLHEFLCSSDYGLTWIVLIQMFRTKVFLHTSGNTEGLPYFVKKKDTTF
jgi:hypothetical protein